jgi:hypothetical protein
MYTSYIGKQFLALYNKEMKTSFTGKEFFNEIFFPLFFDNEKHLMHVSNSPFFQRPSQKALESGIPIPQLQLQKLHADIDADVPNMAVFVGFAAKDVEGTTSGQLTSMNFKITADEMYASWIGEALAIGVSGGLVMLIDNSDILWALYKGWKNYRTFLSQSPNVKDKQMETWNGHWLYHSSSRRFNKDYPLDNFKPETAEVQGNIAIPTLAWSKVIFALAKGLSEKSTTAYIYNLSQTNTTLGFINLYLTDINKMYEMRDKLFIDKKDSILSDKEIDDLTTFFNLKSACKFGTLGLQTMEPDKLRDYMPKGSVQYAKGNDYKFNTDQSYLNFNLYKIWIIAMLNKTELLALANKFAQALVRLKDAKKSDNRGKTNFTKDIEDILVAKNIPSFIDGLQALLQDTQSNPDLLREIVEEVLKMPNDHFPLFLTLIRFEHTYHQIKNN